MNERQPLPPTVPDSLPNARVDDLPNAASPSRSTDDSFGVPPPGKFLSRKRLALAFAVAGLSDFLSIWLTFIPPVQWAIDITTAILLFIILGWRWQILPGLIAEAIPGLQVFPVWILVVATVSPAASRPLLKRL